MFIATPGTVPASGTPTAAGIELPPGRALAHPDDPTAPIMWMSESVLPAERITELFRELMSAFPATGLWPLHTVGLGDHADFDSGLISDEFVAGFDGQTVDPVAVFSGSWNFDDEYPPAVPFTGLADPVPGPEANPQDIDFNRPGTLVLVPVDRPANVSKVLGWLGPTNYGYNGEPVSAALRSWEDRFGAIPTEMTFDTITVYVPRPPSTDDQRRKLAAEHYGFCPDNIDQGIPYEQYLEALDVWSYWAFWWD
ncbi:DUF4253 domain-containing protein [Gordonia sp. (in: high G+C Gram-positive bacteria)]|uniref:DUF4253 domain-containing protein n=1 Tax=Gordonia sp. (in: high G+C Gram-positive bacteria) TaxID=84139 RepID=UPI0016B6B8CC|nr:DUF4253 domain-containing protein [Gordonia sp. (in: high G+C Gram-positive bacteria)]NLG46105.1 DUF4253 domain-containing protein [Gordonia sp. (in: high G+C Gram-positive bacteria)]